MMTRLPRIARTWSFTTLLCALFVTAGCATTPETDVTTSESPGALTETAVSFEVENDLMPPSSLTISLVPQTGARQVLGVVQPSETTVLRFEPRVPAGPYRLVGETTSGTTITSREFVLGNAERVEWDVNLNTIRVLQNEQ